MQKITLSTVIYLIAQVTYLSAFSSSAPSFSTAQSIAHTTSVKTEYPSTQVAETASLFYGTKSHKVSEVTERILEERLKRYMRSTDYYGLGLTLRDVVREGIALERVKELALRENFIALIRAVNATAAIVKEHPELGLTAPELIQMAIFIETILPLHIEQKQYYLSAEDTGLLCAIEYDPLTQYRFIHLGYDRSTRLGRGAYKTVTKSVLYKEKHPEVLARCKQSEEIEYELEMTKKLQSLPGIVKARAHTSHQENDTTYYTMFCKLYNPGSLSRVLDKFSYRFTLKEKMAIALNILKGLEGLQKNGIVHKDLGTQNYLINISKRRKDKTRKIDAVISDLGCSIYVQDAEGVRAQGHSAYTSPEAIFVSKMKGEDYFRSDLFAVGCMFYQIFYETRPKWVNAKYIKGEKSEEARYKKHVSVILKETRTRRRFLSKKLADGFSLSPKEEFERMILRMCNPSPHERGTATEHREKVEQLILRVRV